MRMVRRELHYVTKGRPICGQGGERVCVTDSIESVTCRKCAQRNYEAAVRAHYRAFPELRGPRGRRQVRLGIEAERRPMRRSGRS